jgi:hypothetical protein
LFLRQMTKLRGLHLTNAFLTGCGIEHLLALKSLEYLDLNGTNVDDASLRMLSKLKCLKTLHLSSTAVTDQGIRKLQALKKLRTLTLHDSLVTKDCCVRLGKFMPKCEIRWSAHDAPKPNPAHLPKLFIRDTPEWDPGWYLKLVADTYKIKIEDVKIRARPNTWIAVSNFRPSQSPWFDLIEWQCTPRDS